MLRAKGTLKNSCGECGSCELPLPPVSATAACSTRVLAVDLMRPNVHLLTHIFRALNVPGKVIVYSRAIRYDLMLAS